MSDLSSTVSLRFYSQDSSFVHGGLERGKKSETKTAMGQKEINDRIQKLQFRDARTKIKQVDAHPTLAGGVVIQVTIDLFLPMGWARVGGWRHPNGQRAPVRCGGTVQLWLVSRRFDFLSTGVQVLSCNAEVRELLLDVCSFQD